MHPDRRVTHVALPLEGDFQRMFMALYRDLRDAFEHPFDWMAVLERPRWWQFRRRAAHNRVGWVFLSHGFLLTDGHAWEFLYATPRQAPDEDCGGAIIRRLRTVFQYQTGVPYAGPVCIEGGRDDGR